MGRQRVMRLTAMAGIFLATTAGNARCSTGGGAFGSGSGQTASSSSTSTSGTYWPDSCADQCPNSGDPEPPCDALFQCALKSEEGLQLCPGWTAADRDYFLDSFCLALATERPILCCVVQLEEGCVEIIATAKLVFPAFADVCDSGAPEASGGAAGTGGTGGGSAGHGGAGGDGGAEAQGGFAGAGATAGQGGSASGGGGAGGS